MSNIYNNTANILLPSNLDKYPFKVVDNIFRILKNGNYQVIITDSYKRNRSNPSLKPRIIFEIINITDINNPKTLFSQRFGSVDNYLPFTINAVINVQNNTQLTFGFHHMSVSIDGVGYGTFFIKYLGD